MEYPKFLQTKTTEEKKQNVENFQYFSNEITSAIDHTIKLLEDDAIVDKSIKNPEIRKASLSSGQIEISYKRLMKDACVAILDLQKNSRKFSCIIKNDMEAYDIYKQNINVAPKIKPYLPEVYDVIKGFVVFESVNGIEEKDFFDKLSNNEQFRKKFAKNTVEFLYTASTNNLVTGDVALADGHNIFVDPETANIKLIEIDSIAPYPSPGYRGSKENFINNELLMSELMIQFRSLIEEIDSDKGNPTGWQIDYLFQVLSGLLQKINPEDLKIKYRYVLPSHVSFVDSNEKYGSKTIEPERPIPHYNFINQGITINPELVQLVRNMDISGIRELFNSSISAKESIFVKLPNTPENIDILR